jgi:flavoprotein
VILSQIYPVARKIRDVDIETADKLRKMQGITVIGHPEEIRDIICEELLRNY